MEFECLPDDVLLHIFSFLEDGLQLLDTVPLVCRRWYHLAREPAAWRGVELDEESLCGLGDGDLARLVLHAPFLGNATRYAFPEGSLAGRALRRSRLAMREFHYCSPCMAHNFRDDRGAVLDALYRSRHHLRRVSIAVTRDDAPEVTDSEGRSSLQVIASLKAIEELDLYDFKMFPYAGELAAGLPRLRRLRFYREFLPDALLADLVRGSSKTLRELVVHRIEPLPPLLAASLAHCTELEELRVREGCLDQVARCGPPALEAISVSFDADGRSDEDAVECAALVGDILARCGRLAATLRRVRVVAVGSTGNSRLYRERCERVVAAFQRRQPHLAVTVP